MGLQSAYLLGCKGVEVWGLLQMCRWGAAGVWSYGACYRCAAVGLQKCMYVEVWGCRCMGVRL